MLGGVSDGQWEELLESQPDYIKDLHRRLQQACQKATLHTIPEAGVVNGVTAGEEAAGSRPGRQSGRVEEFSPRGHYGGRGGTAAGASRLGFPAPSQGSADEGAGGGLIRRFCSVDERRLPSAIIGGMASAPDAYTDAGDPPSVDEVAKEVLRLRLLKRQHDELRTQLARAETQLKRLSPHSVLQLHSYLERNLSDPSLAKHMQEPLVKLLQCLCAVCNIDVDLQTPEALLSSVRKLLRDPHSFTSKLCNLPRVSSEEAQGLAHFLLCDLPFKRVREKDINACYETLHAWLSAFHFFSAVAEDAGPVARELDQQEALLRMLKGKAEELVRSKTAPALPPPSSSHSLRERCGASGGANARGLLGGRGLARSPSPLKAGARGPSSGTSFLRSTSGSPGCSARPQNGPGAGARSPPGQRNSTGAQPGSRPRGGGHAERQVPPLTRMQSVKFPVDVPPRSGRRDGHGSPSASGAGRSSPAAAERHSPTGAMSPPIHRRSTAPVGMEAEARPRWSTPSITRTVSAMPPPIIEKFD